MRSSIILVLAAAVSFGALTVFAQTGAPLGSPPTGMSPPGAPGRPTDLPTPGSNPTGIPNRPTPDNPGGLGGMGGMNQPPAAAAAAPAALPVASVEPVGWAARVVPAALAVGLRASRSTAGSRSADTRKRRAQSWQWQTLATTGTSIS
ncbi:MAG: hypothetical protein IPJ65_10505 [Archangiaceae bacterium]|nr:hypothetical protein [Archangiaceae bacterium]